MATIEKEHGVFRLPDVYDASHRGNGNTNGTMASFGRYGNDAAMETSVALKNYGEKQQFPAIIVRDIAGRPLDTNTSYQRAIYEAKWKFSQGELPQKAEEWRLPHAPLPARPDFTRTAPPLAMQHKHRKELKKSNKLSQSYPQYSDTIDSDKGYESLRWSLQQAETLPPLAGAQLINMNSCRVPPKTYFPFVGAAPATKRFYLETDIREAEYEFPGFCSGCTKGTGLCYGCEKDSKPHFHRDKVARTGGGFVYLKHDRAYGILAAKNPANWNVAIPEEERRRLEQYLYPQHPGVPGHRHWLPGSPKLLPPTGYVFYDDVVHPDFKKYGHKMNVVRLRDSRDERFVEDVGIPYDPDEPSTASRIATYLTDTGYDDISTHGAILADVSSPEEQDDIIRVETGCPPSIISYDQRLSTLNEDSSVIEEDLRSSKKSRESTKTTTESGISSRAHSLYKAPSPFKLKSAETKLTIPVDPFSKNREYNIPTGGAIEIKKSDKPLTEFDEFQFGEGDWKEPTFEGRARTELTPTERSRPPTKVTYDRKSKSDVTESEHSFKPPAPPPPPPTSESKPESITMEKETKEEKPVVVVKETPKSNSPDSALPATREHSVSEATLTEPIVTVTSEDKVSVPGTDSSPPKREKRPRAPIVKKERKQREPPVRRSRRGSMKEVITEEPEPVKETSPTPEPAAETQPEPESETESEPNVAPIIFKEHSLPTPPPMRKVAPPPLPKAAPPVPPLPREYTDMERPKREVSQTLIEAPPPMYEPPKQRRPPPIKRPKAKSRERRLPYIRQADVPKEQPEIKRIADPLDYLAKYCIIHKDRLPHYERIFNKVVEQQQYRYADVPHDEESKPNEITPESETTTTGQPIKTCLTSHEEKMINDLILINRSTKEEYAMVGYNIGDQNVQKVNFTLDTLINKYEELQEKHDKIQADRIFMISHFAKKMFPEVLHPNYKGEKKKKKKKKSKKNKASEEAQSVAGKTAEVSVQTEMEIENKEPKQLTEVDIVKRLTGKMLDEISKEPDIAHINLEIERIQEKLRDVDDRIEDLEDEKKLLQLYSRDVYLREISQNKRQLTFLRRQSALYQKMHPNQDPEMNLNELEDALQQINGHLISEKELQFIYHILDLKSRRRINLQLFCVVAALSEKVKQVDPFVRKLIKKFNYEALNVKMDKSKELFWLLDDDNDEVPSGKITATSLALELAAGGVSPEHTQFVVNKFNRESKGTVDFLDYLTYVPLFIELHGRIVDDPLSSKRIF